MDRLVDNPPYVAMHSTYSPSRDGGIESFFVGIRGLRSLFYIITWRDDSGVTCDKPLDRVRVYKGACRNAVHNDSSHHHLDSVAA